MKTKTLIIHFAIIAFVIITCTAFSFSEKDETKSRDQIDPKYTWDLTHIYKNENLWEKDFAWVEKEILQYKTFDGIIGESPKNLLNYLQFDDEMGKKLGLLSLYAKLSRDLNIQDQKNKERWGRIKKLQNRVTAAKYFVRPEILEIPEKKLNSYLINEDQLQIYSHLINDIVKTKEHTLNKEQEHLFSLSSTITNISSNIYFDMQVDRKDPTIIDDKGNENILNGNTWEASKVSFDRSFREQAYKGFFTPFMAQKNTYASLLNGRLQAKIFEARMHNYNSAMEASLSPNNIPVSVYNNLIQSVNENTDPLHRWMSLKKEALVLDTLHSYDSYVTIFPSNDKQYTFEEAKKIIIESLKPLGEEYIRDLNMAFNSRWVDVYHTEGKAVGAYSSGTTYGVHPYVVSARKPVISNFWAQNSGAAT
jgi:oligoendopeptidase F